MQYGWPGNVRELENACERIAADVHLRHRSNRLPRAPDHIRRDAGLAPPPAVDVGAASPLGHGVSLDDRLREVEASLIGWALRAAGGNKSRAAELLHVKRTTLADRISRHGARIVELAGPAATPDTPMATSSPA